MYVIYNIYTSYYLLYYMLDILSNGSQPEKVLKHTAKVFLSCKTLLLDDKERTKEDRPYATTFVSGVGVENVTFEPRIALDGKVCGKGSRVCIWCMCTVCGYTIYVYLRYTYA